MCNGCLCVCVCGSDVSIQVWFTGSEIVVSCRWTGSPASLSVSHRHALTGVKCPCCRDDDDRSNGLGGSKISRGLKQQQRGPSVHTSTSSPPLIPGSHRERRERLALFSLKQTKTREKENTLILISINIQTEKSSTNQ